LDGQELEREDKMAVSLNDIYKPSEDIVLERLRRTDYCALVAGIGETDDLLFTLNKTGKSIWSKLDGKRVSEHSRYAFKGIQSSRGEIEKDVIGIIEELVRRK